MQSDIPFTERSSEIRELAKAEYTRHQTLQSRGMQPNIVTVLDKSEFDTEFRIYMEYCNGGNLLDYMNATETTPLRQFISIFFQLNCGLAFCHGYVRMNKLVDPRPDDLDYCAPVLHRDLKPANGIAPPL
jgi:serine/threonine protein kinase